MKIRYLAFLLFLLAGLSGCATMTDPEASQEYRGQVVASVTPGQSAGQSFILRRAPLTSIDIWINVKEAPASGGVLSAELYPRDEGLKALDNSMELPQPVTRVSYALADLGNTSQLSLLLPTNDIAPGQACVLWLSTTAGEVQLLGRSEDAYAGGEAFASGVTLPGDLSFRLNYRYQMTSILEDLVRWLPQSWLVIPFILLFFLPGWLLLDLLDGGQNRDTGEALALSLGLSLSILPAILTWTSAFGLSWNRFGLFFAILLVLSGSVLRVIGKIRQKKQAGEPLLSFRPWTMRNSWVALVLITLLLLTFAQRLAMVRDLAAPAWVDSVHHATLARLIVEQGAFPDSYTPYIESSTASYHAGFHAMVAAFSALTGLELADAMLWLGQALNALAALATYLFTLSLTRSRLAAFISALIPAFIAPMPAYYTSWGRYTQLAGLLILPAAFVLIVSQIEDRDRLNLKSAWKNILLAGTACAGILLTHYRVGAFLVCLLVAWVAVSAWSWKDGRVRQLIQLGWIAALSGLITLPWWPATIQSLFVPNLSLVQEPVAWFADFSWRYLTSALGTYSLALAGLGLVVGVVLRRRFSFLIAIWVILLFAIANMGVAALPGSGFINNTSVEISLFMPLGLLVGFLFATVLKGWDSILPIPWKWAYRFSMLSLLTIASIFGAAQLLPIFNPITLLFRDADRPAIRWIENNLPQDATFLINSTPWGYNLYAGQDGGYWITPMTGRKTVPPPLLYGLDNDLVKAGKINDQTQEGLDLSQDPAALHDYLLEENIEYIYLGARGGTFSHQTIEESGFYRKIYQQAGVWIFEVLQNR